MQDDIMWQIIWGLVTASVFLYGSFLFLGNITSPSSNGITSPVPIKDELYPGMHKISGVMPLTQTCDQLMVRTVQTGSTTYELRFETWPEPAVTCPKQPVVRGFSAVLFAPPVGVELHATLDGQDVPVDIKPIVVHTNAAQNSQNTITTLPRKK